MRGLLILICCLITVVLSQDPCPAGESCTYSQTVADCSKGDNCTFICSDDQSCNDGTIRCGTGQCTVLCSGTDSCAYLDIYCGSNGCNVQCSGNNSCLSIYVDEDYCRFKLECTGTDACLYRIICEGGLVPCNPWPECQMPTTIPTCSNEQPHCTACTIAFGVFVGIAVLVALIIGYILYRREKRNRHNYTINL